MGWDGMGTYITAAASRLRDCWTAACPLLPPFPRPRPPSERSRTPAPLFSPSSSPPNRRHEVLDVRRLVDGAGGHGRGRAHAHAAGARHDHLLRRLGLAPDGRLHHLPQQLGRRAGDVGTAVHHLQRAQRPLRLLVHLVDLGRRQEPGQVVLERRARERGQADLGRPVDSLGLEVDEQGRQHGGQRLVRPVAGGLQGRQRGVRDHGLARGVRRRGAHLEHGQPRGDGQHRGPQLAALQGAQRLLHRLLLRRAGRPRDQLQRRHEGLHRLPRPHPGRARQLLDHLPAGRHRALHRLQRRPHHHRLQHFRLIGGPGTKLRGREKN